MTLALHFSVARNARQQYQGVERQVRSLTVEVGFEDASRIRAKPVSFARIRSSALNILRASHTRNVSHGLYINPDHAMAYHIA